MESTTSVCFTIQQKWIVVAAPVATGTTPVPRGDRDPVRGHRPGRRHGGAHLQDSGVGPVGIER